MNEHACKKIDPEQIRSLHQQLTARLLSDAEPSGYWQGRLSNSALAAATAAFALQRTRPEACGREIKAALAWLCGTQNLDGGWGDTPDSPSNLSTTLLCWSALAADEHIYEKTCRRARIYIQAACGSLQPDAVAASVVSRYGDDKTFSVPILAFCALAGRLGPEPDCWNQVPRLPFELAVLPHRFFKLLRLPVVSYAIPALIAIGLLIHRRKSGGFDMPGPVRERVVRKVLKVLTASQPPGGGFLEAVPLTAFVCMSLCGAGYADHPVVIRGIDFLLRLQREDGSWPIDIDLSTWVTTLAVSSLDGPAGLPAGQGERLKSWLLEQQLKNEHPFTHAAPGGWGWTCHAGSVPDADDTSGALLALGLLGPADEQTVTAAQQGIRWLLRLQNRDGGLPTFCRGWGRLPFDKSCPDITAHGLRAWLCWQDRMPAAQARRIDSAVRAAVGYLQKSQRPDGSWLPLWFGNQQTEDHGNPLYGTSRVVKALSVVSAGSAAADSMRFAAIDWIVQNQNSDGGWGARKGTASTIEETALALEALAGSEDTAAVQRGLSRLCAQLQDIHRIPARPIGLYFASLWYSEALYPVIFSIEALKKYVQPNQPYCQHRPFVSLTAD